ncbi:MAG: NgoFVII family restriction endonuclease [Alkaliphilus sp.]|nr:DUF3427 domain-containing protein [Alkaliphilus sp. AH-315-G20]MBN4067873.1 DUF3427 domain-containing protein [Alkaliphilus transvaalensis]PHS28791.1 MAG: NgoFVII family restriction endonuclease [Alkaliphilus sp.]
MKQGIYNLLITDKLNNKIQIGESNFSYKKEKVLKDSSLTILSHYMREAFEKVLLLVDSDDKVSKQIEICNEVIKALYDEVADDDVREMLISKKSEVFLSVIDKVNSKILKKKALVRPITSIIEDTLFTGADKEYSIASEIKKEILSSDRIDILVSFIKMSGINLIIEELKEFTQINKLRIITTCYMGATDYKAIKLLAELSNTEVKISYDTERTRLHAKSYYFYRESGFSTAYIGSSNMSKSAMSSGLEWNVKVTEKSSKKILEKFNATFEAYWSEDEFKSFIPNVDGVRLKTALRSERFISSGIDSKYIFEIKPYAYQENILEKLEAERLIRGNYKNLIVAATGTGKTVISAFDFKNFKKKNMNCRLLFIAHREEILKQSLGCYRGILRDQNFAEIVSSNYEMVSEDNIFITIQSFNSKKMYDNLPSTFYDYIVIDETHHAAAGSYEKLINHFEPKILLGLTATPERMDGEDILKYFDGRISAEIRLGEAINRKLLSPFQYFCVSDSVDLSDLKWQRGGYNVAELSNIYTKNLQRVDYIVEAIDKYINDIDDVKGIGFCAGVEHAIFMKNNFNKKGIPSISLYGKSSREERNGASKKLKSGEIKFIFVADLYNEGVDIPEINTVMFLRPTESTTIFLQQLGRGLRLAEDKECLTILDFVGQANKSYRFNEKIRAILGKTYNSVKTEIQNQFPNLPRGCYIHLEKKAKEYILDNIEGHIVNKRNLIKLMRQFRLDTEQAYNIKNFTEFYHIQLEEIYKNYTFSQLSYEAGLVKSFDDIDKKELRSGIRRLISCTSRSWLEFVLEVLDSKDKEYYLDKEVKMILMLHYTLYQKTPMEMGLSSTKDIVSRIVQNKILTDEMKQLIRIRINKTDFIEKDIDLPLMVHSKYVKDQVLAALGDLTFDKKVSRREGACYIVNKNIDMLFVTFDKSEKDYSPETMYKDYAISRELFHWQSQNRTTPQSETGKRYINSDGTNNQVLLFVREYKKINGSGAPFYFLGKVTHVSNTGSKPMDIIWKLEERMTEEIKIKTRRAMIVG